MPELSGAGGFWRAIDEKPDSNVVQQQDNFSCGPACGEMLLKDRGIYQINQSAIARETGTPVDVRVLAQVLNLLDISKTGEWRGGNFVSDLASISTIFERLIAKGSWAAEMKEFRNPIAHLVVVDGIELSGKVLIRDPWEGTKYKMEPEDFFNYWNTRGVYREINL